MGQRIVRPRKVRMPLADPSLFAPATGQSRLRHRLLPFGHCFSAFSAKMQLEHSRWLLCPLCTAGGLCPFVWCSCDAAVRSFVNRQVYFLPFSFSFVIALLNWVVSRCRVSTSTAAMSYFSLSTTRAQSRSEARCILLATSASFLSLAIALPRRTGYAYHRARVSDPSWLLASQPNTPSSV